MLGMLSPGDRLDAVRGLRLLADAADALLSRPGTAVWAEVPGQDR